MNIRFSSLAIAAIAFVSCSTAFLLPLPGRLCCRPSSRNGVLFVQNNDPQTTLTTTTLSETSPSDNRLGLTPELQKLTTAFENIGDDKLRYKQLLFMANQLKPLDASSQIPGNKVRGCLSTVYIDGTTEINEDGSVLVQFTGDSDGVLTKGLVALLVRGLSGNTAADIQKVDPSFIKKAGIEASLTPGRNNGFLNMLAAMKSKAIQLEEKALTTSQDETENTNNAINSATPSNGGQIYNQIVTSLQALRPVSLELKDVSSQHAGHREGGDGVESHFELYIVADAFADLNLVKRHKLIYMLLGDVMPRIHALQIQAKTPIEIQK